MGDLHKLTYVPDGAVRRANTKHPAPAIYGDLTDGPARLALYFQSLQPRQTALYAIGDGHSLAVLVEHPAGWNYYLFTPHDLLWNEHGDYRTRADALTGAQQRYQSTKQPDERNTIQ